MVVTCESCESKFNLDDSLIKDSGSKVRCSNCQHVFTVFKPAAINEEESDSSLEADTEDLAQESAEEPLDFDLFESEQDKDEGISLEDFGLEEESDQESKTLAASVKEDEITPHDLGFGDAFAGQDMSLSSDKDMAPEEGDQDSAMDGLTLEEESSAELEMSGDGQADHGITDSEEELFFEDLELEEESGGEGVEQSKEPIAARGDNEDEISFEDLSLEEEPSEKDGLTPVSAGSGDDHAETDLSFEDLSLEETSEQEDGFEAVGAKEDVSEAAVQSEEPPPDGFAVASLEEGEDVETQDVDGQIPPPEVIEQMQPTKPRRTSLPLMICLIVVLIGGGAYAAFSLLDGSNIKIPFLESIAGITGGEQVDPGNLQITLMEDLITGTFLDNGKSGRLFVVKGKIRSNYPDPRNFIRMKGILYLRDGKVAQDKIVYCGNVIPDTEIQSLDAETINKRLSNRFGDNKTNFKVSSGQILPFMVIFSGLPEELGEFSVEVVDSLPG